MSVCNIYNHYCKLICQELLISGCGFNLVADSVILMPKGKGGTSGGGKGGKGKGGAGNGKLLMCSMMGII